jgi:hypothetical protein
VLYLTLCSVLLCALPYSVLYLTLCSTLLCALPYSVLYLTLCSTLLCDTHQTLHSNRSVTVQYIQCSARTLASRTIITAFKACKDLIFPQRLNSCFSLMKPYLLIQNRESVTLYLNCAMLCRMPQIAMLKDQTKTNVYGTNQRLKCKLLFMSSNTLPCKQHLVLKELGLLRHVVPDHSPRVVLVCSTDHTGRDTPDSYTTSAILDLIEKAVILALGDRVLPARRLDRSHSASLASFRSHRCAMTATRLACR